MKIYCSGIGGIGLSAYAALQKEDGHEVIGSDRAVSSITDELEAMGVEVFTDQDGSHIPEDCDLFCYSEAIPVDAPERQRAAELGIPQQSYFHALGELSRKHFVIAVCGTHGKSSTTAMAAKMLIDAGADPTVVVGTKVPDLDGKNWRKGESEIFLLEACEYRRSFLALSPDIAIVTNVDGDHFDAFKDLDDYHNAFRDFLEKTSSQTPIIGHGYEKKVQELVEEVGHSFEDADMQSVLDLKVPGLHMQQNAQLVLSLAMVLGFDLPSAEKSLKEFKGSWRRMEEKGTTREGAIVVDDYGHHPHEIAVTLNAIKSFYEGKRVVCVFQPHTHDRTLKMYKEFLQSFVDADSLYIAGVYDARSDIETGKVSIESFALDISTKSKVAAQAYESFDELEEALRKELTSDDVLLCMGAGDITDFAAKMVT